MIIIQVYFPTSNSKDDEIKAMHGSIGEIMSITRVKCKK